MKTQGTIEKKETSPIPASSELAQLSTRDFAVQAKPETSLASPITTNRSGSTTAPGHSLQNIGFPVQAKLTIGEPNDKYEQEADRVAAQVVQQINTPTSSNANSVNNARRKSDETIQMKPRLQRRDGVASGEASSDLEASINQARGGGQALDSKLQKSMGQAMGADFSGVKIHTDSQADTLNRSIQARAFTTGQDLFFKKGEYDPGSRSGQELIAHELTHVVQQNGNQVSRSLNPKAQISHSPMDEHQSVVQRKGTSGGNLAASSGGVSSFLVDPDGVKGDFKKSKFYKNTYIGALTQRGSISAIDDKLKEYYKLLQTNQKAKPGAIPESDLIKGRLQCLYRVEASIQEWLILQLDIKGQEMHDNNKYRLPAVLDLQQEIENEKKSFELIFNDSRGTNNQSADIKEEIVGSTGVDDCLKSRVGPLLEKAVPKEGGRAILDVELKIKAYPPGYLGFKLNLEIERESNTAFKARARLTATGGVEIPKIIDIKGEIGGYIEAQGKNGSEVMNLMSYGLYQNFLKSKLVPEKFTQTIWGGSFNSKVAKYKSEKFAKSVEDNILNGEDGDDSFVDLGFLAGASATVGDDKSLGGEVGYKYTNGTKYSKQSVNNGNATKGASKGENVTSHEFSAKIAAGPFSSELIFKKSGDKKELEGTIKVGAGLGDGIIKVAEGVNKINKACEEYEAKRNPGKIDKLKAVGGNTQGLYGISSGMAKIRNGVEELGKAPKPKPVPKPSTGITKQVENGKEAISGAMEKAGIETDSAKSAQLILRFEKEGTGNWQGAILLEKMQEYSLDANILKASVSRATRLAKWNYKNGEFAYEKLLNS
jgi:Domain of unknown function (DUF4157)